MKRGWIVLLAALFIALGAILWELGRAVFFLVMFQWSRPGRGVTKGL